MTNEDDKQLEQMIDQLLDGQIIGESENSQAQEKVGQLQQLMNNFSQPENDFNVDDLLGQPWGDMQIREVIGQGGMGVVYLADEQFLNRQVALKVLNGFALNYMDSESFVNEAKLMAQVRHPHIMAVFGAGINNNIAGYWGELLTGETVEEFLKSNSHLNQRDLSDLCLQLTDAVQAIHDKGLVHGDIKSNNVLIEKGRGAVLMDFGTSFDLNDSQAAWFRPSTPLAMAPEQFNGEKPTQASDVFSLGVLFHLLVTRHYPYSGNSYEELKTAVLNDHRNQVGNHGFNKAYLPLIDQMLCPDPKDSPTAQEVIVELQKIRQLPLQRAKNRVFAISTLALLAITAFSLYLAYSIKQSEQKVLQANQQILAANQDTEELNNLLTDIIYAPSYVNSGKDVLVKDVILEKATEIKSNDKINEGVRNRIYLSLAHSLASFGERGKQIELLQAILDSPDKTSQYYKHGLINMAHVKIVEQSFDEIEKLLAEAEKIKHSDVNIDRKQNIYLHGAYADYYMELSKFDKALEHSEQVIALWELQELNADAIVSYYIHGQTLLTLSRFDEAIAAYNRCIELALKFRGPDNYHVFIAQMDLAIIHAQMGDFKQSITLYEKLLLNAEKFLGSNQAELFGIKMNFAFILSMASEHERSLAMMQSMLKEGDKLSIDRRVTILLKPGIAETMHLMKDYERAESHYHEAIVEAIEFYPPNHEAIMTLYTNLAELFIDTDRPKMALDLVSDKRSVAAEQLGNDHSNIINMDETMARSYYLLNQPQLAIPIIDSVIERRLNILGDEHESTIDAIKLKETIIQALNVEPGMG